MIVNVAILQIKVFDLAKSQRITEAVCIMVLVVLKFNGIRGWPLLGTLDFLG